MVAAELGQEGDGLLGPLLDEFAEQPRQRLAEHPELGAEVGWEKVSHRQVDGEPFGVELADRLHAVAAWVDRVAQHPQPVAVIESHDA